MQQHLNLTGVQHRVTMVYDEECVLVLNSTPLLEECLFFTETVMEESEIEGRRPTKTVREKVAMFLIKSLSPVRAIQTHQGFLKRLRERAGELGYIILLKDDRHPFPSPLLERMFGFRGSQGRLTIQLLLASFAGCLLAPTRFGKCFGPETLVMTPVGPQRIANLKPGDLLLRPNGRTVKVLAITQGREPMIRVTPKDKLGDPWLCTFDHPLMLHYGGQDRILRAGDALRLLDTQSDFSISVRMLHSRSLGSKPVHWTLRDIEDWERAKTIPSFMAEARPEDAESAFRALCVRNGWLERDGESALPVTGGVRWLRSLQALARQAGYRAAIINGQLRWSTPELQGFAFTLDAAGTGPFVGPQLEGDDPTFLLADGTVVHNTTIIVNICRAFPTLPTVIALPGIDLVRQLADDVKAHLPDRRVSVLASGSRDKLPSDDITVASIDSLHRCDPGLIRLLLVDEPHAAVTDPRIDDIMRFEKARRYAIGATLGMRYDKRDPLVEGLFGPVHARITFPEAVAEKSICPIVAIIPVIRLPTMPLYKDRDRAYEALLFMSERVASMVRQLMLNTIPKDWQALIFIKNEKQAEYLAKFMPEDQPFIAMAKRMANKAERNDIFEKMRSGAMKRCLSSSIYAQGVTFPDLRVVMNLAGGGPYQSSVQKPGRLAQIRPGKRCGVLIDIQFEPDVDDSSSGVIAKEEFEKKNQAYSLCRDSTRRIEVYKNTGYDINYVRTISEFQRVFITKCL